MAERTERVYSYVMEQPSLSSLERINSHMAWGPLVGLYGVLYQLLEWLIIWFVDWYFPERDIDIARNF